MTVIVPTVGRIVWYWPAEYMDLKQPFAAIVTYVHSDRLINLSAFLPSGEHTIGRMNVPLLQEGDIFPEPGTISFAVWMPYQMGQAKKAEIAESALAKGFTVIPEKTK